MAGTSLGAISVRMEADTAQFQAGMAEVERSVQAASANMGALAVAAAGAFAGMAAGITKAVQAASAQEEAELKLASAIRGSGQAVDIQKIKDYASALQEVSIFGDEATLSGAAILQSFNLTEDALVTLIPAMQNTAAFLGTDMKSAALQLGKAIDGSVGGLSRMGISLTETQKAAFESANRMERVALLAEIVKNNVGDVAMTLTQTAGGAFAQLSNAAGDLAEQFGFIIQAPLVDAMHSIKTAVTTVVTFFSNLSETTKTVLGYFALASTAIVGLVAGLAALAAGAATAMAMFAAFKILLGTVITPIMGIVAAFSAVVFAGVLLRKAIVDNIENIKFEWQQMVNKLSGWWDTAVTFWTNKINEFMDSLKPFFDMLERAGIIELGEKIANKVKVEVFEPITESSKSVANSFKDTLGDAAQYVADAFSDLVGSSKDASNTLADDLKKQAQETADRLKDGMTPALEGSQAALEKLNKEIDDSLTKFIPSLDNMSRAMDEAVFGQSVSTTGESFAQTGGEWQIITAEKAEELGDTFDSVGKQIGDAVVGAASNFGTAGEIISAAAQGFQTGGPWGAIIAVILQLLSKLKSFMRLVDGINAQAEMTIATLEPMMKGFEQMNNMVSGPMADSLKQVTKMFSFLGEGMQGVFQGFGQIASAIAPLVTLIMKVITPLFEVLGLALRPLGALLAGVGLVIGWVVNAIIDVVSELVKAVAEFVGFFTDTSDMKEWADELKKSKSNLKEMEQNIGDIWEGKDPESARANAFEEWQQAEEERADTDYNKNLIDSSIGLANAFGNSVDAQNDANKAASNAASSTNYMASTMENASKSFQKATVALMNVPQGFKIAAARFAATATGAGFGGMGEAQMLGATAGGTTINIESIGLTVEDPEDFLRRLQEVVEWGNFTSTGTTINTNAGEK